tara:strand:- start:498 stop:2528 length:2031 start_codon:yes stop_codon:yes gene_type:complete
LAAKEKYLLTFNLGFLGLNIFLSLFEIAIGKENVIETLYKDKNYNFSIVSLLDNPRISSIDDDKGQNKKDILLSLKIYADKQYDFDQNVYIAEGNVKAIINGGILRADLLKYEKLSGIVSAEGNVRFTKGDQYFRAKEFKFNTFKKEGIIKDVYGILNIKNVLDDLKIDSNIKKLVVENRVIDKLNNEEKSTYYDGIEFSFGNIEVPKNKITRSNKSIGSINNWRFKSDLIIIKENHWKSNKIIFTNDPFDPHQISFQGIDVIAEEDDGNLLITSSKTNLLLGSRNKFFLGRRIFGEKKKRNKFKFKFDGKDRDGLFITRRTESTIINNNFKFDFEPQFLINRAILGKTNSYDKNQNSKSIRFSDLFGLKFKLNANYKDWNYDSLNDLSTLNTTKIFSGSGIRHSSTLSRYLKIPILDEANFNIFTTYRSRVWNGSIGETEIKSAYGGFIEKTKFFKFGEVKNNLNLRFGTAKYEAEEIKNSKLISLWRSSTFASLDSEYQIWKMNQNTLYNSKGMILAPVLINPELIFRTNIDSAYFKYEDGSDQGFIKLSLGPEIRLGRLERNFLDYTKLSIMPGIKFKSGNSPFKFDNAVDLKTLNFSFIQQIYGPLMIDIISNLNIDNSSVNYGEYYDTKLGILFHQRAYEFGIYYHPDNEAGGLYFRLNGFNFDNSVKSAF